MSWREMMDLGRASPVQQKLAMSALRAAEGVRRELVSERNGLVHQVDNLSRKVSRFGSAEKMDQRLEG